MKEPQKKKFMPGYKYMILATITFLIVAIDQYTKMIVHSTFDLSESIRVIPNFFNLTYVRNLGAAWGIFSQAPDLFRQIFFLSVPPVAVLIIVAFIYNLPEDERSEIYALSAISGGAIGNYIDRLRFGYVIDFLDFHIKEKYSWPAFNVADMAIVCGVAFLIFKMFTQPKPAEPVKADKPTPPEGSAA